MFFDIFILDAWQHKIHKFEGYKLYYYITQEEKKKNQSLLSC